MRNYPEQSSKYIENEGKSIAEIAKQENDPGEIDRAIVHYGTEVPEVTKLIKEAAEAAYKGEKWESPLGKNPEPISPMATPPPFKNSAQAEPVSPGEGPPSESNEPPGKHPPKTNADRIVYETKQGLLPEA